MQHNIITAIKPNSIAVKNAKKSSWKNQKPISSDIKVTTEKAICTATNIATTSFGFLLWLYSFDIALDSKWSESINNIIIVPTIDFIVL